MSELTHLTLACAAFVGTHLLLSHPLRMGLVKALGLGRFMALYSLVAFATFGWILWAWMQVPANSPPRVPGDVIWIIATVVMLLASILLAGSFTRNPALPSPDAATAVHRNPVGVFAITRHPMMWSIALWAIVHLLVWPTPENHILATAMLVLALLGSAGQDRKKAVLMGDAWRGWCQRTAFFPFAGQLTGRISWVAIWPGMGALIGGLVIWLAATWAHVPFGGRVAAGIWRWWGG